MIFALHCDVVALSGELFSGLVESVVARSSLGELGISFGHAPLLIDLVPSSLRIIKQGGREIIFQISGGFLELHNNNIKILVHEIGE